MDTRRRKLLAVLAVALVLWFLPIPEGLTPPAWHIFAIFAATILGFILQPIAIGAMGFIGVTVAALTGTISVSDAISGYGNSTIWLILGGAWWKIIGLW